MDFNKKPSTGFMQIQIEVLQLATGKKINESYDLKIQPG
jgi:hypothetical protein